MRGNLNRLQKEKLFIFLKKMFVILKINSNKQMVIDYLIFSENK